jgi:FixJ family two-component response regulator
MQTPEQPFHVCIVDDEASARLTAIAALDTTEFSVREFHNAQELLDDWHRGLPQTACHGQ